MQNLQNRSIRKKSGRGGEGLGGVITKIAFDVPQMKTVMLPEEVTGWEDEDFFIFPGTEFYKSIIATASFNGVAIKGVQEASGRWTIFHSRGDISNSQFAIYGKFRFDCYQWIPDFDNSWKFPGRLITRKKEIGLEGEDVIRTTNQESSFKNFAQLIRESC